MQSIHIFRAGKHTSAGGQTLDFTEDALRASAAAYDPAKHEAPIVVGHPRDNAPAYGWINSLTYAEDGLHAEPAQIDADFAELTKAGKFKKVSASFYTPDSPQNPVPGVYYLRHVGFLGAQPPAVKGLKAVAFADGEAGVVEFSDAWTLARFLGGLREWFIDKFNRDEADKVVPAWMISDLEAEARAEADDAAPQASPAFSEPTEESSMTPEEIQALQARAEAAEAELAAAKAREASFAEREAEIARREAEARRAGIAGKVDALVAAGKVLPAKRDGLIAFLESLPADASVEFGEGEAATKQSSADFLYDFLGSLPAAVEFGEIAPAGAGAPGDMSVDELAKKAADFREAQAAKGITISVTDAVQAIRDGKAE